MQLLSDPSFLPALFKPKLHGAAYGKGIYLSPISSISFGYSGRNGSFLPTQPSSGPPFSLLFHHVDCSMCVTWPDYHPGTLHFHIAGPFHAILLCCSVLCVRIGVLGLGPFFSELVCRLPYHTLRCGCVKWSCQWICV